MYLSGTTNEIKWYIYTVWEIDKILIGTDALESNYICGFALSLNGTEHIHCRNKKIEALDKLRRKMKYY